MATKKELWALYNETLELRGISPLEEVNSNSNKTTLEQAISCLNCPDERLDDYMVLVKLKYPHVYTMTIKNPDWKLIGPARQFVFNRGVRLFEILNNGGY